MIIVLQFLTDSVERPLATKADRRLSGSKNSGDFIPSRLAVSEQEGETNLRRYLLQDYLQIDCGINL